MKKILKNIMLSALTVASVASCADDRNNFLPDDSFGFNNAENDNVVTLPIYGGSYDFAIIKSGKGLNEGTVEISTSNSDLIAYNKEFETSYFPLPKDGQFYSFSTESISFGTEEVTKSATISWDIAKVAGYMSEEPENSYCIPVVLHSDDLDVNEGRNLFILNLVKSTVTAEQTLLSKTIEWESEPAEETMNITVRIDKAIPGIDLDVHFEMDESLVSAYNEANGTAYTLAPDGLVTLGNDPTIKAGESYALLPVTLNTAALVDEATGLVKTDWDGYVAPVKIKGMSIDGVETDNGTTFIVIKGLEPIPPQLFSRVWGLYSTSSALPWYQPLGFDLNTDRNMTMDDEYVYIASSSASKICIKAISISDASVIEDVNIEGVAGGTYPLSFVRVVKNTDETVNGGKDILLAGNLGISETNKFYAWVNGINNPPLVFAVTNAGRRLGDKMVYNGTWQSGSIILPDYNKPYQAVRVDIVNGLPNGGADTANSTDAYTSYWPNGAITWGDPSMLAASTITDLGLYPGTFTPAVITTQTGFAFSADGAAVNWTSEADYTRAYGFNFFDNGNKHYIAYFQLEETKTQGRVIVLEHDGTAAGLQAALENKVIAFEAPVQDPSGIDFSIKSPIEDGYQVGDCAVHVTGSGDTYLAAMQSGGGLVLYKMN